MSIQFAPMQNQPNLPQGETAYEVVRGDGSAAYAACWTDRATGESPSMFGIVGAARAINADGTPILDGDGHMIHAQYTASVEKTVLVENGVVNEERRAGLHTAAMAGAINAMLAELAINEL